MMLVAGLAVAGLIGVATAFFFSIRSSNRGGKRLRSVSADRDRADRRPESRSGGRTRTSTARRSADGRGSADARRARGARSRDYLIDDDTGLDPELDFADPVLIGARRDAPAAPARTKAGADSRHTDPQATNPRRGQAKTDKPRRRVGFRKGADLDEELWPTEEFGGVSDEQFWDDLASDKPLTTTARPARQEPGLRNRLPDAAPPAAMHAAQTMTAQVPRLIQPVQTAAVASQPTSNGGQPPVVPAQPAETHGRRRPSKEEEDPLTSRRFSLRSGGPVDGRSSRWSRDMNREQFAATIAQEILTFTLAETEAARGGYPAGVRPFRQFDSSAGGGSVGPRASEPRAGEPRARAPRTGEPGASEPRASEPRASESRASESRPGGSRSGGTSPYPNSGISHGSRSSATQTRSTPPYGGGSPVAETGDPPRREGTRSNARHGGADEGFRTARQVYPQGRHQAAGSYRLGAYQAGHGVGGYQAGVYPAGGHSTGGYPVGGYQGNGYRGNGYPGNGHRTSGGPRTPYGQGEDYRRLIHQRCPSTLDSCPRETSSGTPPGACTRRWQGEP